MTKQIFNMALENNALRGALMGWAAFNVIMMILLIYVAIKLTMNK
jgi:hypothetical protein